MQALSTYPLSRTWRHILQLPSAFSNNWSSSTSKNRIELELSFSFVLNYSMQRVYPGVAQNFVTPSRKRRKPQTKGWEKRFGIFCFFCTHVARPHRILNKNCLCKKEIDNRIYTYLRYLFGFHCILFVTLRSLQRSTSPNRCPVCPPFCLFLKKPATS